jgi:hypothetical protein
MHTPSPLAWITALLLLSSLWLLRRSFYPPSSPAPLLAPTPTPAPLTAPTHAAAAAAAPPAQPSPSSDALDTSWTRTRCLLCRRAFSLGTLRCPYDASPCVREYIFGVPLSSLIVKARVCPRCGVESDASSSACAACVDTPPHLVARVQGKQDLIDIQPVVICPRCDVEQVISSLACCVRCAAPLSPALLVAGRFSVGYPSEGVGPKTRVCPQCGARCAPNLLFCARDGAKLVSIN